MYSTKQRKELLAYLSEHADEQLSVRQIASALSPGGISLSAVYRNLALLEKTGVVKRCTKEGSREVYYRYVDIKRCGGHLHLCCKQCGLIIHLDDGDTERLLEGIARREGFNVHRADTILYGLCKQCEARIK